MITALVRATLTNPGRSTKSSEVLGTVGKARSIRCFDCGLRRQNTPVVEVLKCWTDSLVLTFHTFGGVPQGHRRYRSPNHVVNFRPL